MQQTTLTTMPQTALPTIQPMNHTHNLSNMAQSSLNTLSPILPQMSAIQPNINPMQQNMSFNRFPTQWSQNNNPWSSNKPMTNHVQNGGNWNALDSLLPTVQQQKQPMNQMMTQKQPLLRNNQSNDKGNALSKDDIMDLLS